MRYIIVESKFVTGKYVVLDTYTQKIITIFGIDMHPTSFNNAQIIRDTWEATE